MVRSDIFASTHSRKNSYHSFKMNSIFLVIFTALLFRYILISVIVVGLFDNCNFLKKFKISQKHQYKQYREEIFYSLLSILIFSFIIVISIKLAEVNILRIAFESDINVQTFFKAAILVILHDLYFYIVHHVLHRPWFYKKIHYIHHKFQQPSIFSTFCFHPVEALFQFMYLPIVTIFLSVNLSSLLLFGIVSFLMNAYGHCGYDFFKDLRYSRFWKKVLNTSTHHNMHHHYNRFNYSLYFNYLDYIFKTNNKKY